MCFLSFQTGVMFMKRKILINFLFILPISLILLVGIVILYFFNSSIEKLQTNIIENKYVQLYTGDAKLDATETANIINLNYTLENSGANYLFTYDKLVLSDYLYLNGEQKQLIDDTIYISDYIYLLGLQNALPEAAISSFVLTSYSQCAVNNVELNTSGYYKYGIKFKRVAQLI